MDPLSLIASITGILTVAAKITTSITNFIQKEKDFPASTHSVLSEVSGLSLCIGQLSTLLQDDERIDLSRRDEIPVDQLIILSTSLILNMSELEKLLDSFGLDQPVPILAKLRWVRNEKGINTLLTRVRASRSSLDLMLNILTWHV